jgi:hypothetical protein
VWLRVEVQLAARDTDLIEELRDSTEAKKSCIAHVPQLMCVKKARGT